MKKLKFLSSVLALILAVGVISSCDDNGSDVDCDPIVNDADLVAAIQSATNKQDISESALPTGAQSILDSDFSESFVSRAQLVPEVGYEVTLRLESGAEVGERSLAYFNLEGQELRATGRFVDGLRERGRLGRRARGLRDCFDFVFPISLTVPDGSTITLESREDWSLIRDWYQANPDAEDRPAFVFPLDIQFGDELLTINSLEELREAKGACEVDRRRGRCFELVFPITFVMPDASEITLGSREDWPLIDAWYEANPDAEERPDLVYPVQITYDNNSTVTINSAEEMRSARAECEVDRSRRNCFQLVFPVSFIMPDGTSITLDSREDWTLIRDWYAANPDAEERPDLVFPIEIEFRDGSTLTINSEEELRAARSDCR